MASVRDALSATVRPSVYRLVLLQPDHDGDPECDVQAEHSRPACSSPDCSNRFSEDPWVKGHTRRRHYLNWIETRVPLCEYPALCATPGCWAA